jgi:hypothetical protein
MTVAEPKSQRLGHEDTEMNHGIVQGMLVSLGNIYGYETYVPAHDQTVREFQGQRLSNLVTVKQCDDVFRGPNLSKVREIDVLWFDEDDYGLFPVYAFEAEHTTRVKSGMDRLLKIPRRFPTRFFVVAPTGQEEALFNRLVNQTPFRSYQDKFTFRLYNQLEAVYNTAVKHDTERRTFGLSERYRKI